MPSTAPAALAQRLASLYGAWPQVEAVALGGSHSGGLVDPASDIDLYVFTTAEIPLAARETLVRQAGGASRADLGLTYWGPGDEWYDAATGLEVDVVYFEADWMREQIRRVINDHQASLGYSTCLWHTGRQAHGLYDPRGWLQALQRDCQAAYPEALRRNIITLNQPVLRAVIPSYFNQIAKAVQRRDWVSVNHRLAALLASYFDILFAFNRVLHPGEKRLVAQALARCPRLPAQWPADLDAVLQAASPEQLLPALTQLLDRLDELLQQDALDPR